MTESAPLFVLSSSNVPVQVDRDFFVDFMSQGLNVIAQSEMIVDGVRVVYSTVFNGSKAQGGMFETRIFGGAYNESRWIYHSYNSAVEGHKSVVGCFEQEYGLEARPCIY